MAVLVYLSRLCTEGTISRGIHTSSPSFMCFWAARSKLNRLLGQGASSTSIRDSGLDPSSSSSFLSASLILVVSSESSPSPTKAAHILPRVRAPSAPAGIPP